ncbi:SRPBCC family protein [Arenibaculum pallidiluteum]|uniref:SRPBCC family protein n=1 Tax=Arenibaculum pallidiluteum TaxID=2812559 RepID=UPI001A957EFC|nr:SRPBCC family protein [Arenibaculum pallidiluteum]
MAIQDSRQDSRIERNPEATARPAGPSTRDLARHRPQGPTGGEGLAKAIGWFSIGLGLAAVAAPRGMARTIGVPGGSDDRDVMLAVGLREIVSGLGVLSRDRPAGWMWARVGGDAMDLTLLAAAMASEHADRNRLAGALAAVAGITALDILCAQRLESEGIAAGAAEAAQSPRSRSRRAARREEDRPHRYAVQVRRVITINRPREEIYAFWRDLRNLPRFMSHLEAVETIDDRRSHWRATGPGGTSVAWDAEITEDRPNELLAWRSMPGADVDNAGWVRFEAAPGGRGTVVRVDLHYTPPAGRVGAMVAKLFGRSPDQEVQEDLRKLKQVMETGEVTKSDATFGRLRHPGQPPTRAEIEAHG